ncbi:hypothetical protein UPYG_G00066970 [Umbra pygmaea]|uniref:Ig-like domain-containing protein n=1 Tax=Umbra pygmaea TaxID=75934 RepID=A0ABD0XAN8_UMBPY
MWEPQKPSLRMGTHLLLLTATLLSTCQVTESQALFTIKNVSLTIEPDNVVFRGTNVTLRCQTIVSSSGILKREYSIYKDNVVVYTDTRTTPEDLLYPLPLTRVADTGKYKCQVTIQDQQQISSVKKLTVTGLQTPVLHLNKGVVNEGEDVILRCSAPEETGSIIFYFYKDTKDLHEETVNTNHVEFTHRFDRSGVHRLHCDYRVILLPDSVRSNHSNSVVVTVKELLISPVISVEPSGSRIIEGDFLKIVCSVSGRLSPNHSSKLKILLTKGQDVLSAGQTRANYSVRAMAEHSGAFECVLQMGNIDKRATEHVIIKELFSKPVLAMEPKEVFEMEEFNLTCKSSNYSSDRISMSDLKYSFYKDDNLLAAGSVNGIYILKAQNPNGNYFCKAEAMMVSKFSEKLTVRAKVLVSKPEIKAIGRVIVGKLFQVRCHSDRGSLPIYYTLLRKNSAINQTAVWESHREAIFPVTIQHRSDIQDYKCRAKNHQDNMDSNSLNTSVTVPLSSPELGVSSDLLATQSFISLDVPEGYDIYLVCSVQGSYPVSFKWYRDGTAMPILTRTLTQTTDVYQIEKVDYKNSGIYYCEANNSAQNIVRSQAVTVDVKMAKWKKVLIGACCLLVGAVLVLGCVLFFKSKRGKRDNVAELSVKPSSPKSDDSLTVSLTHDTMEVYKLPKGEVEAGGSVWSEMPVDPGSDLESITSNNEPDVEYTEVVHPQPEDSVRVPLKTGAETVYSEVQSSPTGPPYDHHDYGSVEYADLNGDQPEVYCAPLEVNHHDLNDIPAPVE